MSAIDPGFLASFDQRAGNGALAPQGGPPVTAIYPYTADGLLAALTALGSTRNAVADTLRAGGYRGDRGCDGTCPVAVYLTACFPEALVRVWAEAASILRGVKPPIQVLLPEPVFDFVATFDMDDTSYPDLEWKPDPDEEDAA